MNRLRAVFLILILTACGEKEQDKHVEVYEVHDFVGCDESLTFDERVRCTTERAERELIQQEVSDND